jgi:hypothetical protein
MLHRQVLASRNMSEALQTVFEAVISVVNCVNNSPLGGTLFAKLCNNMETEHTVFLYSCEIHWLSHAKVLHRVFDFKEEITIFFLTIAMIMNFYSEDFIQKLAFLVDILKKNK